MGLQSQMSSAAAGGSRPTVPCQDEPGSTARRYFIGSSHATAPSAYEVCGSCSWHPCGTTQTTLVISWDRTAYVLHWHFLLYKSYPFPYWRVRATCGLYAVGTS